MLVPVNLYVDRMSPVQPVRTADVYALTQERSRVYTEAAAKIGLTASEYTEFRDALDEDRVSYGPLPRRIDAMAGVHRRSGHVYALRNVLVPSGTMGWKVSLADGTTVLVPNICGNLSLNHAPVVAHRPRAAVRVVARRPAAPAKRVRVAAAPLVPVTAVTFAPVTQSAEVGASTAVAPAAAPVAAASSHSVLPYLAPLIPVVYGLASGGSDRPVLPLCSGGSNEIGACRQ